jgi:hypothetical protein
LLGPSAGVLLPLVGVVAAVSVLIGVDEPLPLVANATPPPIPMSATTAAPAIKVVFVAFNIVESLLSLRIGPVRIPIPLHHASRG